jgi:hypothetical protein
LWREVLTPGGDGGDDGKTTGPELPETGSAGKTVKGSTLNFARCVQGMYNVELSSGGLRQLQQRSSVESALSGAKTCMPELT